MLWVLDILNLSGDVSLCFVIFFHLILFDLVLSANFILPSGLVF